MASKLVLIFSSLLVVLIPSSSLRPDPNPFPESDSVKAPSPAHAKLMSYGFPIGLLPAAVVSNYTVDHNSGGFSLDLEGACKITLPPDNYLAMYSKKITGKIVEGKIAELDGITVRAFFRWWAITGIRADGDNLVFEVGMVTAKYPIKNFDQSPACEGQHSSS